MDQAQHKSIFLIRDDATKKGLGTAFVVHSDDTRTFLVTCAHVIEDRSHVFVEGRRGDVVASGGAEGVDVAVVRMPRIESAPFLLGRKIVGGGRFCTAGFSPLYGGYWRKSDLRGTFGEASEIWGNQSSKGYPTWELRVEGRGKFVGGLSGSPLVSETTGKCVGIVIASQQGEGHGISVDAIGEIYSEADGWLSEAGAVTSSGLRMNLEDEVTVFQRMALGDDLETKVILIQAPSGMGKSRLLDEYQQIAKDIDLPSKRVHLRQQIRVDLFLREISAYFGNLSNFTEFEDILKKPQSPDNVKELYRAMGFSLLTDIAKLETETSLAVLIDEYEKSDELFAEWLAKHFISDVAINAPGAKSPLILVIAGQEKPLKNVTGNSIREFCLQRPSLQCWSNYLKDAGILLDSLEAQNIYNHCNGLPQRLSIEVARRLKSSERATL